MLVEMIATSASPDGILHAGKVYNLPRKQAEALLKQGPHGRAYARPAKNPEVVSEPARAVSPDVLEEEGDE